MVDQTLSALYRNELALQKDAQQAVKDLSPANVRINLMRYEHAPDAYFGQYAWLNEVSVPDMRADPDVREKIYDTIMDIEVSHALDMIADTAIAEIDFWAFSAARLDLTNDQEEKNTARYDIKMCRKRLSDLSSLVDDAEFDTDEEEGTVQTLIKERLEDKTKEYVQKLGRGRLSGPIRSFLLEQATAHYLSTSQAYTSQTALQVAIIVMRLEAEPGSVGDTAHESALDAMRNDLKRAQSLTELAATVSPELRGPMQRNAAPKRGNGHNGDPKNRLN